MADALRIDPDDLAFDLLPDIERSFAIKLPRDLRHVETVGDLHRLILSHLPDSSGAACGTLIAFHLVRRALVLHGLDPKAGPDQRLKAAGLPAPRRVEAALAATGLVMPRRAAGGWCLAALGLGIGLPLLAWWRSEAPIALSMPVVCWAAAQLDRGRWTGDWATLGTLARATAALNHAALAERGARHSPAAVWNTVRTLLSGYGVGRREMGPATRLTR